MYPNSMYMYPNGIKVHREKRGMSQKELADVLGIKRELLSYYENGSRGPASTVWLNMAEVLGVEVAELLKPVTESPA